MKLIRVGVDLAKNVFQVHGVDRNEKPVWRRRLTRANWLQVVLDTMEPGCQIGMDACGGAQAAGAMIHGKVDRAAVREALRTRTTPTMQRRSARR